MPTDTATVPIVDYLNVDGDEPHLTANECTSCGAHYLDRRNGCGRCGRLELRRVPLASTGVVRTFTIVHRAAADMPAPFVAVVVDLDGGGTVRANLTGVDPVPDAVEIGMRVRLVTRPVDDEVVGFAFEPASAPDGAAR